MMNKIKLALGTSRLEGTGRCGGGCINEGEEFLTDNGHVFFKRNNKYKAREMFEGEFESLKSIIATGVLKAPLPLLVVDNPEGGAVLVMEYIEMTGLHSHSKALGERIAKLHLHNLEKETKLAKLQNRIGSSEEVNYVSKFGFHITTCCGFLPQDNTWCDDWMEFYSRKLHQQILMIEKKDNDRELLELWGVLQLKIPQFFAGLEVKPSLLHGDLWSGNVMETSDEPVVFDPASFYGHHEYDLAIADLFGGFNKNFWDEYYRIIPKEKGWKNRHKLYKLFHNLNHWNHFGGGYRSGSLQLMRDLC